MLSLELKEALISTRVCKYLEPNEIDTLLKYSRYVAFATDKLILKQGEMSEGLYIIIDGKTLVSAKVLGEGVTTIATLNRGDILGEISLLEKGPCVTSVTATSEVHCLLITHAYFDMLSLFYPETKYKIIRAITEQVCERINAIYHKIIKHMHHSDMIERSIFGEVIRTLTKPSPINFEEAGIDFNQLKTKTLFTLFSQEEIDLLLQYASLVNAPKKCILIHEGEVSSSLYILLRGAVQSSIINDNIIAKLSVLGPFELFCSVAVINTESTSIINYMSCERAILFQISDSNLTILKNQYPELWYKLYELICLSFVALEKSADKLDIRLHTEFYNR